ncbi:hypothetical protein [Embleya hyalina]|uniref:Secreted protein n=1 Tax=Embleya hyalina TaxID=516124 RepID=A0A401YDQ1_9ACTN|nr:hypothetical protein [Embleya hyalina]GCD92731.1 hypothetical protein EHYA_00372 [Embleya hyalina]
MTYGGSTAVTRGVRSLAVVAVLGAAAIVAVPTPAYAGGCTLICSETMNQSNLPATVARNYCEAGSTGDYTSTQPTCSSADEPQEWRTLAAGERTPQDEDWDTFRVDTNWCYKVFFESFLPWGKEWTSYFSASPQGPMYVKVGNDYTAHIKEQTYGPCRPV